MKFKFLEQTINYDGSQLKSLFSYMNHGVLGDSIVAFIGSCNVPFEHMVDGEDVLAKSEIRGAKMLHFIVEEFGVGLELMVTRQRLLSAIACETLNSEMEKSILNREGDDLYDADKKLSISIATVSPVSGLIHFAMNIVNEGTPVKTCSLNDFGLEPTSMAHKIAERYVLEIKTIKEACSKVHWVK